MPTYEYECRRCGHRQEQTRRIAERDLCPPCTCGARTRRLQAAPMGRVVGGTPKSNDTYNYADRFTADITGKHMEEVAGSGLHTPLPKRG